MSCFIPPLCVFCSHFDHTDNANDAISCSAFVDIPDEIFTGQFSHTMPYPGDKGITFQLNAEREGEFEEVNKLRCSMNLKPYPGPQNTHRNATE